MEEWKECTIGDVCNTISDTYRGNAKDVVLINTSDVLEGKCLNHQKTPNKNLKGQFKKTFQQGDILYSEIRPANKRYAYVNFAPKDYIASTKLMVIRHNDKITPQYLFYILTNDVIIRELQMIAESRSGTFPQVTFSELANFSISLPSISQQKEIVAVLKSFDSKIDLNRRINDNLEQQAQALFNYYFIDTPELLGEFSVGSLADAANYVNGLAMQKYRPINGEKGLPVLKIKELGQGRIDSSSDFCSNEIDSYYKVYDGDVIFSWSGTLMVKIWCGGKCGLNQHLFKVSSKTTPKWFYYFWTKHHLDNFIRIAKDKAVTMGHIKRGELEKAEVLFPNNSVMKKLDILMAPFLDQIIEKECEIRKLTLLRDTLLPKLISGELVINDINN